MADPDSLANSHCQPCAGKVAAFSATQAAQHLQDNAPGWSLATDAKSISRDFKFKNFYQTMAFANAIAWFANHEDHHPDLALGYGHCRVTWSTHSIDGLSENDFICALKTDRLLDT